MVYKLQCILHAIFLCFVKKYRKILKPCLNGFKNSETLVHNKGKPKCSKRLYALIVIRY
uniref:Uncharacterized protein n=1 Tax=uncultured Desulfobacterium sp. TaxID=201089 RepID=E1YBX6_9BACT|nr:unknown protein [uncultured Desulfobacterium sp.]